MDIQHHFDGKKGTFFIDQEGERGAELVYNMAGDTRMIIEHTEVMPLLEGQGAGKHLVFHAVDHAMANNLKVIPLCPFAKLMFDRYPELRKSL